MNERKKHLKADSSAEIAAELQASIKDVGTPPKNAVKIKEKLRENKPSK